MHRKDMSKQLLEHVIDTRTAVKPALKVCWDLHQTRLDDFPMEEDV